jgi:hypothetical protein
MGKDVDIKIPQPFQIGLQGGVDVDLDLQGLDDIGLTLEGGDKKIGVDLGLDNINAKIDIGLNPIQADFGLDNIKADFGLDNINACFSFGITEFPRMRVHLPTKYEFGLKILGINLFSFFINGKSMLITEDNPVRIFHKPMKKASSPTTGSSIPRVQISPNK